MFFTFPVILEMYLRTEQCKQTTLLDVSCTVTRLVSELCQMPTKVKTVDKLYFKSIGFVLNLLVLNVQVIYLMQVFCTDGGNICNWPKSHTINIHMYNFVLSRPRWNFNKAY